MDALPGAEDALTPGFRSPVGRVRANEETTGAERAGYSIINAYFTQHFY